MPKYAETNACTACARSKRRCSREVPSCARCIGRGKSCIYPSSRSAIVSKSRPLLPNVLDDFELRVENELLADFPGNAITPIEIQTPADEFMAEPPLSLLDSDIAYSSSLAHGPSAPLANGRMDWFLAPKTWRISYRMATSADVAAGEKRTMKKYIAALQSWFERWVKTGSNPFIHHRLYSANFPACVQIAYASLASYIHRTPENKDTILQIIEDRSNSLLQENGAVLNVVGAEQWADEEDQEVDLFAQLARLHALMVYQIIGLFDGDIRSRFVAEGHVAIQNIWAHKLFQSAGKTFSNTGDAVSQVAGYLPRVSASTSQEQWYLWILAESIRRTWLVASSMSPIFTALQQGWAVCPGGIMYTNRSGLWNAESASVWEKQCLERDAAFLHRFDCGKFFDDAKPADIDEFGMAMLTMTFSEEALDRWRDMNGGL